MSHATYRSALTVMHIFNAMELLGYLQDWVNSAGSNADVDWYYVSLGRGLMDSSCPVARQSLHVPEREQEWKDS